MRGAGGAEIIRQLEGMAGVIIGVTPAASSPLLEWDLGPGETDVLAHASTHEGWWCVLDDKAARRAATHLGYPVVGTLGLVAHAVATGTVLDAVAAIEQVRSAGLYVSDAVVREVLDPIH